MKTYDRDGLISLIETVSDIRDASDGCHALYFHLSKLDDQYRSDYQIRIAYNILSDLLKNEQGAIFLLDNADIVALYYGGGESQIEKSVFQLRYLFMDDAQAYDAQGYENPEFCDYYDLSHQWQRFYDYCLKKLPDAIPIDDDDEKKDGDKSSAPIIEPYADILEEIADDTRPPLAEEITTSALVSEETNDSHPQEVNVEVKQEPTEIATHTRDEGKRLLLTASHLGEVIDFIRKADLSNCLRRQPICYLKDDNNFRRVYEEIYVDITTLEAMLPLPLDVRSNKMLFQCLTEYLDRNVLAFLADDNISADGDVRPVSLNMNCRSLMTDAFARFDASVPPALKKRVVVEIHVSDVFFDPAAYMLTRDLLQHKGYRICIDGSDAFTFPQLDREILGFDLVKLGWGADISHASESVRRSLIEAVANCGSQRVVLCRSGNAKAVEQAKELGIKLLQGRYIDGLLKKE